MKVKLETLIEIANLHIEFGSGGDYWPHCRAEANLHPLGHATAQPHRLNFAFRASPELKKKIIELIEAELGPVLRETDGDRPERS